MTKYEKNHLRALEKRRDWLNARIYEMADSKVDMSYDRQEVSALDWAIGIVEKELKISELECKHYWLLRNQDEVFCQRCLEIKKLVGA